MAFGAGYAGAGFGLALLKLGVLIAIARRNTAILAAGENQRSLLFSS